MLELKRNQLVFSFPEIHPRAKLTIEFQRTLRIPDDGRSYPLPPGLGRFPVRHVDDFAQALPPHWLEHGGVMLPMYQSEALWLRFHSTYLAENRASYPFAIKVAAGKINAVTGQSWAAGLCQQPQDYLVAPMQPWLDGYCVEKGYVRQFIAMPLGAGYTAEEQLTGEAEHGGLQLLVHPMKADIFARRFPRRRFEELHRHFSLERRCRRTPAKYEMGIGAGGKMKQDVYEDRFELADWDLERSSRCFVHIVNSLVWRAIAGNHPPTTPPTAKQYTKAGLPWYDYYDETARPLEGSPVLQGVKSVAALGTDRGQVPLPENEPCNPAAVVPLHKGRRRGQVREGAF
jgi:hypothetical protein